MQTHLIAIKFSKAIALKRTAALLAALALSGGSACANSLFDQPDPDFNGRVSSMGVVTPGSTATIKGSGFKSGQEIQLLRSGKNVAQDQVLTADKDGRFSTTIAVPTDAVVGRHPVVVQVANPSAAAVFEFKVSPDIKFSGAEKFHTASERLLPGMYQSAYSAASNALFVTSAVGRPPVKKSTLLKVDADTLKIKGSVTPAVDKTNDKGQLMAVYGVAVDDALGTVWVTNTRANTVAVYKQSDLSLIKQFDSGVAPHARDVVVDGKNHRAYVSAFGVSEIIVFDTQKLEQLAPIAIKSRTREDFSPLSLALDTEHGKLYTVSLTTNEAAVIDLAKQETVKVYALPGAKGASGVAVAPEEQVLFVASQGSDNVLLLDLNTGDILHSVSVGAGPLNAVWDAKNKLAYVISRGAGSIAAIDLDGKLVANLDAGSLPNHLSTDGKGAVFAINKARGQEDETRDRISKIIAK